MIRKSQKCLQNVDAIALFSGGTGYEGAFFREVPYDEDLERYCFSTDASDTGSFGGIVFAEHRN